MRTLVSKKLERIQEALKPLEIPGKPADAPVKPADAPVRPAHLAKLLGVAPSSLSRWMKDEVVPRGQQKERLDVLYRTILEAERNEDAKKILKKLISPTPAIGLAAGAATIGGAILSPIRFGLHGAIAAAGLDWLLADKENEDTEEKEPEKEE